MEKMQELQIDLSCPVFLTIKGSRRHFPCQIANLEMLFFALCTMLKFKFPEMNARYYFCLCTK